MNSFFKRSVNRFVSVGVVMIVGLASVGCVGTQRASSMEHSVPVGKGDAETQSGFLEKAEHSFSAWINSARTQAVVHQIEHDIPAIAEKAIYTGVVDKLEGANASYAFTAAISAAEGEIADHPEQLNAILDQYAIPPIFDPVIDQLGRSLASGDLNTKEKRIAALRTVVGALNNQAADRTAAATGAGGSGS